MWNAEPPSERTPRITVFDEGQDIGLGLSSIRTLNWTLDNRIEMKPTDRMGNHLAPAGPDWVLPSAGWSDVGYRFYHEDGQTGDRAWVPWYDRAYDVVWDRDADHQWKPRRGPGIDSNHGW